MRCKHCEKYFGKLKRNCTKDILGECDCPVCQGLCNCEARTVTETDAWGNVRVVGGFGNTRFR